MKFLRPLCALLLAAPLIADDAVYVTGPGTGYAPLAQNVSVIDSSEMNNAPTSGQMEQAVIEQGAAAHQAAIHGVIPSRPDILPSDLAAGSVQPQAAAAAVAAPAPYTGLQSAVNFILSQRVTLSDGTKGLPATYAIPAGVSINNQVIQEGTGLYDTSVALMALIQNGNYTDAKQILDIYANPSGQYGVSSATLTPMDLRAFPNSNNGGSFTPFDSTNYYDFDFTKTDGQYNQSWQQYDAHTGPNAWLALAACQYIGKYSYLPGTASSLQPYMNLVKRLGNAMIDLQVQDGKADGAIRYGPNNVENAFNEINTENDLSAYSALNAIATATGQTKYSDAANKILGWLQNTSVYNPITGKSQNGMMDPSTGLFYVGTTFTNGRWQIQTGQDYAGKTVPLEVTDSGGTWAISALGPAFIDAKFGAGAAYKMWTSIRQLTGRTASQNGQQVSAVSASGRLDGLDFTNLYAPSQGLISPEWTAGGVFALQQLINYYHPPSIFTSVPAPNPRRGSPQPVGTVVVPTLTSAQYSGLINDETSMKTFLATAPNVYAEGSGLGGSRQGQTGFGTTVPPATVSAMASVYSQLYQDPLVTGSRLGFHSPTRPR